MSRSIVIAVVFGALVTGACKKKGSESAAKQEPAKVQEGQQAPKQDKEAAKGTDTASPGVKAGGIQHDAKEGPAGVLAAVKGTVEVRPLGETKYAPAKADAKLYPGDTVRTGDASMATIALADESVIELSEITTVAVASRDGTADPASSAAVLGGVARFSVTPRAPAEGPFRVYTPAGLVVTRGTTYGVGVAASGEARVGVENGAVDVIGLAQLDGKPVTVEKGSQVVIAADGKLGAAAAWPADDWGTWRDETDAKLKLDATLDAHAAALAELGKAISDTYLELQATADGVATFEATAATSAEKNDPAAYQAAQPNGAIAIDASFLLDARLEALTWAYAGHASLATDIYVRHPDLEAHWTPIVPSVDAAILWPKRYEVTAVAYFEPLRTQYYVHHPVGRAHAALVGITVPEFYAKIEPAPIDPIAVRGKIKGQVWLAPEMTYHASMRPIWVTAPTADWSAKVKVNAAPPRAKVAWYVRPPTLKANVLVGAHVTGKFVSKLDVAAPEPRASLMAMWTIPVGAKIKIEPPDLAAGASARAKIKLGADGRIVAAPPAVDVKGDAKAKIGAKVDAKIGIKAPNVHVKAPNVKANINAGHAAAVKAGGDIKAKVDGAAKADAKVDVKVKPPEVKLKGEAKGGFKIGN